MPNKPIEFRFDSDVTKLLQGIDKAELSIDDLEDAIKKLPKASEKAADGATADFRRIENEAADAGRETGQEFASNLGESLTSGGGIEDIMADTVGGLVGSLSMAGPIGAAIGGLGAGALIVFQKIQADAQALKDAIEGTFTSMWSNVTSSMGDFFGEVSAQMDKSALVQKEFTRLWEEDPKGMQKLVEQAKLFGISAGDIVAARAGDEEAIKRVNTQLEEATEWSGRQRDIYNQNLGSWKDLNAAIEAGQTATEQLTSITEAYNQSVEDTDWNKALDPMVEQSREILANMQNLPDKVRVGLEFYSTDPLGQSLISSGNVNYSPGHVAIAGAYQRQGKGRAG